MKKWEYFSKEQLEVFVKDSRSYRELAMKIGYSENSGSATAIIKEMMEYYQFDTSHFLGAGWNKNNFDYSRFQYGKSIKTAQARQAIAQKRGWKCECCGLIEWQGQQIPLELHHKDGNNMNNIEENLQLLCPNCHALTDNYRGKNINKQHIPIDENQFVEALRSSSNIRQALISLGLAPKGGNYTRAKELLIKYDISQK